MKVIITFTFCCDKQRKSKFMALEKPGKLREFFLLLCGHPVVIYSVSLLHIICCRCDFVVLICHASVFAVD